MKNSLLATFGALILSWSANAQTQPMNANFENWETITVGSNSYPEPNDWNTANECTVILNVASVTKSTDAYSGSFSARLESLDGPGQTIVINGVLTTAQMICLAASGGQEGGSAYTDDILPDSIVGYYKYAPANGDSAYSQIMFLANNDQDTISYTRVNFTQNVSTWTRFSAPITPASGTNDPEKLSLFFSSSWGDGSQGDAEIGSVFFIDAVEFVFLPESVNEVYNAEGWDVYPNPVSDDLTVKGNIGKGGYMEVLDITGKQVKFVQLHSENSTIDMSDLVAGVYLYQITTLEREVVRTGKLFVNP